MLWFLLLSHCSSYKEYCCLIVGGVLFKIYIVGEAIKVVRRFSLPNISKRELEKLAGVFRFPRVSCAAASADDADLDPSIAGKIIRQLFVKAYSLFSCTIYVRSVVFSKMGFNALFRKK